MSLQQSKSILKSSAAGSKASKRGVSFATNTKIKKKQRHADDSSDNSMLSQTNANGNGNTDSNANGNTNSNNKLMNDVEEDAFDPSIQSQLQPPPGNDCDSMSLKQIREFKSQRALQRMADQEEIMDKTFQNGNTKKGNNQRNQISTSDTFDGEEEVDDHYSLLRNEEAMHHTEQNNIRTHTHNHANAHTNSRTDAIDANTEERNKKNKNEDIDQTNQGACPIEPFNMTSEREDGSGYFDGDTYVFRRGKGEDEEEDAWLDQLDGTNDNDNDNDNHKTVDATARARTNVDALMLKQKESNKTSDKNQLLTKEQVYDGIISLLATDSESIIQALGRYGSIIKRETKQHKLLRKRQIQHEDTQNLDYTQQPSASNKALNRLTELCNICMMKFDDTAIYDHNREHFVTFLRNSDEGETAKRKGYDDSNKRSYFDVGNDANAKDAKRKCSRESDAASSIAMNSSSKGTEWEYRGNEDYAIHGPYKTEQMLEWIKAGYFIGPMAVDVRMINGVTVTVTAVTDAATASNNTSTEEVVDDLLGDLDSDDDNEDGVKAGERGVDATVPEWQRSDEIDFSMYL
jgi:hypothetical protein